MNKKMLVLVRSLKHGKYCVAGREILCTNEGVTLLDNWVRPVNPSNQKGALDRSDILYRNNTEPRFLDVVEFSVSHQESDTVQSENWQIAHTSWEKMGRVEMSNVIDSIIQEPNDLWLGSGKSDRIAHQEYIAKGYQGSMCLVEVENLEMRIFTTLDNFTDKLKKQRRAIFTYNNVEYNLAITDTDIDARYFHDFPGLGEPVRIITPTSTRTLVAVSLTPELSGYHYKIAGNIIEI